MHSSCFICTSLQQPQRRLQDPIPPPDPIPLQDPITLGCLGGTDSTVPSQRLGNGRWVLKNEATGDFETTLKGHGLVRSFSLVETGGCTCEEIISFCGYGKGQTKFGCSNSIMDWWTAKYSRGDGLGVPYQCQEEEVVRA